MKSGSLINQGFPFFVCSQFWGQLFTAYESSNLANLFLFTLLLDFLSPCIPYTFEHTNFHAFKKGSVVNLEFDIIGKYISRMIQYK